ncbi:MAG: hypothetical protein WDN72_08110 [Alphaproteobacteria bacterium]
MNGQGWSNSACSVNCHGILLSGASVTTINSGNIWINGLGGGIGTTNYDHGMQFSGATVSTQNGDINLTGKVTDGGTGANAISLGNATVQAVSGNVNLTDTGTLGTGIEGFGTASAVTAGNNITYTGFAFSAGTHLWTWTAGNTITVKPYAPNGTLGIGSTSGQTMVASDTVLAQMSAPNFVFGSATTGNQTIATGHDFGNSNVTFLSDGNITLAGTLTKNSGTGTANYIFEAYGDITNSNSAGITAVPSGVPHGAINVTLQSNFDGETVNGGAVNLAGGTIATNGGNITIGGGTTTPTGSVLDANGNITTAATGYAQGDATTGSGAGVLINDTLDATGTGVGGNIIINGKGYNSSTSGGNSGVAISGVVTVKTSNAGTININGIGGTSTLSFVSSNSGVYVNAATISNSGSGATIVTGIGGAAPGGSNNDMGIYVHNGGFKTTGSGALW